MNEDFLTLEEVEKLPAARVLDLPQMDIAGRRAVVTQLQYAYQYPSGLPVVTLHKAEWRKENGQKWLRIEFSGHPSGCNFSGWRQDSIGLQDATIRILA